MSDEPEPKPKPEPKPEPESKPNVVTIESASSDSDSSVVFIKTVTVSSSSKSKKRASSSSASIPGQKKRRPSTIDSDLHVLASTLFLPPLSCSPSTHLYRQLTPYTCGYHSYRTLLSSHSIPAPSIPTLQVNLETSWSQGWDDGAKRHYKNKIVGTKKWTGCFDFQQLSRWCGFRAQAYAYSERPDGNVRDAALAVLEHAKGYYGGGGGGALMLGWAGHCVNVLGWNGDRMLVWDPKGGARTVDKKGLVEMVEDLNGGKADMFEVLEIKEGRLEVGERESAKDPQFRL